MKGRKKDTPLPFTYHISISLRKAEGFFGKGVAELLSLVAQTHSLSTAALQMGMAYSKAWKIIKNAEKQLGYPLIESRAGGIDGGGSVLTPKGETIMQSYFAFERELNARAKELFEKNFVNEGLEHEKSI